MPTIDSQSYINLPGLTLEDFDSRQIIISKIPQAASQTCQGQTLLKPVVKPIPYTGNGTKLTKKTILEFNLSKKDEMELDNHKFDHVSQNIQLAANIR